MTKETLQFEISNFCDNCKEYGTVYYDYLLEKYWCKNCKKESNKDFTTRYRRK